MTPWPLLLPLQSQVATKRQKVIFEFACLSQFLEEQQSVLLAQLETLDADIMKQQDEFEVLVSEEICRFSSLISELEEKSQRPARGLLTVRPGPECSPLNPASAPPCSQASDCPPHGPSAGRALFLLTLRGFVRVR